MPPSIQDILNLLLQFAQVFIAIIGVYQTYRLYRLYRQPYLRPPTPLPRYQPRPASILATSSPPGYQASGSPPLTPPKPSLSLSARSRTPRRTDAAEDNMAQGKLHALQPTPSPG